MARVRTLKKRVRLLVRCVSIGFYFSLSSSAESFADDSVKPHVAEGVLHANDGGALLDEAQHLCVGRRVVTVRNGLNVQAMSTIFETAQG